MSNHDERLDHWIESRLLRRSRNKRFTVPKYTKFTNVALRLLSDIEISFTLCRREDLKFEVRIGCHAELADSFEDLAFAICLVIYRVVEGTSWIHNIESNSNAKENC